MYVASVDVKLLLQKVDDIGDVRSGWRGVPGAITVDQSALGTGNHPTVLTKYLFKPVIVGIVTGSVLAVTMQKDDQRRWNRTVKVIREV
jgi:hypothetical protein